MQVVPKEQTKTQIHIEQKITKQNDEVKVELKQQRLLSTPKKQPSRLSNLFETVKSLTSEKNKPNPLLIDEDLQEDEKVINSPPSQKNIQVKLRQSVNDSILSLPPQLKQEIAGMMIQQEHKIQQVLQQIKSDVKVQIIEAIQKGGPLSKYFVYTIKGEDMHGNFYIKRKYTEFQSLRKILTQRWPGSYIPSLKNKIEMHNQNEKQRLITKILANFITGLSYFKQIYYREEVQLFLRSPDIDFCEMFDHMPELKLTDLISRFQYVFGQQIKEKQEPKSMQIIIKFPQTLRKIISKLQIISAKILQLAESYDVYAKNLSKFGETMRLYEHFSLAQFIQNSREMTVLVKDDERKVDKIKGIVFENIYYELYTLFFVELNDAKMFLESLIAIDLYALRKDQLQKQISQNTKTKQDIQAGNVTIKAMRTLKQKQQVLKNIQDKLKILIEQKQAIIEIYKIIRKTTVKHILPTFKSIKRNNYCIVLAKWIDVMGKQNPQLQTIWNFIKDQSLENINKVQRKN